MALDTAVSHNEQNSVAGRNSPAPRRGYHTNPGPPKHPCGTCSRLVRSNQKGILCEACYQWFHANCVDLSVTEY